ncbi:PliI family lysozyme inhibitor of I-type lysozyme [Chitinibacter sp. SCUT-21]|uniref:PliI family lysozyme inhibitor of I-type lysozyme n=1 Tax=Chitinibacter sp. SCUT-21 TaxID=2970891 RepID=UPI0035A6BD12
MLKRLAFCFAIYSISTLAAESRFVQQLPLPDNHSVIQVAEGDHEPRSIGSYSIRLYGGRNPDFPLDDFISGQIYPRDGQIERLLNTDADGDGHGEVVVVIRSAGSGGYLHADVFSWQQGQIKKILSLPDLPPKADVLTEVKRVVRKR